MIPTNPDDSTQHHGLPALHALGNDLLHVTRLQRCVTLSLPFLLTAAFFFFAARHSWTPALLAAMALCFFTYGSTSHDLVHRTLGLPHRLNDTLLSVIEALSLRSGTAYQLSHLHHHHSLLADDDIEGAPAHGTLARSLLAGITMQPRLWRWAWKTHPAARTKLLVEALAVALLLSSTVAAWKWTPEPLIYAGLILAGSWIFPLVTVYLPHNPAGLTPLTKTRMFRGRFVRLIALDHLYHLEHHLYPAVPHHHWHRLALRLDPHLKALLIIAKDSAR